jgi:hypothetical protein
MSEKISWVYQTKSGTSVQVRLKKSKARKSDVSVMAQKSEVGMSVHLKYVVPFILKHKLREWDIRHPQFFIDGKWAKALNDGIRRTKSWWRYLSNCLQ